MRASTLALCLAVAGVAGQADAQTLTAEPPQAPQGSAIFAGADARGLAERGERLDLLIQMFGGYDDDVLAEQPGNGGPSRRSLASAAAGFATGMGAALNYSKPGLLINRPQ